MRKTVINYSGYCEHCNKVFQYKKDDIKTNNAGLHVTCPHCAKLVKLV